MSSIYIDQKILNNAAYDHLFLFQACLQSPAPTGPPSSELIETAKTQSSGLFQDDIALEPDLKLKITQSNNHPVEKISIHEKLSHEDTKTSENQQKKMLQRLIIY